MPESLSSAEMMALFSKSELDGTRWQGMADSLEFLTLVIFLYRRAQTA